MAPPSTLRLGDRMLSNAVLKHESLYFPLRTADAFKMTLRLIERELEVAQMDLAEYRHMVFEYLEACWIDPSESNLRRFVKCNDFLELIQFHVNFLQDRKEDIERESPLMGILGTDYFSSKKWIDQHTMQLRRPGEDPGVDELRDNLARGLNVPLQYVNSPHTFNRNGGIYTDRELWENVLREVESRRTATQRATIDPLDELRNRVVTVDMERSLRYMDNLSWIAEPSFTINSMSDYSIMDVSATHSLYKTTGLLQVT